jgi:hypothetical protein
MSWAAGYPLSYGAGAGSVIHPKDLTLMPKEDGVLVGYSIFVQGRPRTADGPSAVFACQPFTAARGWSSLAFAVCSVCGLSRECAPRALAAWGAAPGQSARAVA